MSYSYIYNATIDGSVYIAISIYYAMARWPAMHSYLSMAKYPWSGAATCLLGHLHTKCS